MTEAEKQDLLNELVRLVYESAVAGAAVTLLLDGAPNSKETDQKAIKAGQWLCKTILHATPPPTLLKLMERFGLDSEVEIPFRVEV